MAVASSANQRWTTSGSTAGSTGATVLEVLCPRHGGGPEVERILGLSAIDECQQLTRGKLAESLDPNAANHDGRIELRRHPAPKVDVELTATGRRYER